MEVSWEEGLQRVGEYYEGFVKAKNVDDLLAKHSTQTVTTYGTRRSRRIGIPSVCSNSEAEEKENHQPMVSFYAQTLFVKFLFHVQTLVLQGQTYQNCLSTQVFPVFLAEQFTVSHLQLSHISDGHRWNYEVKDAN